MKIKEREMIATGWYPWINLVKDPKKVEEIIEGKDFRKLSKRRRFIILGALAVAQIFLELRTWEEKVLAGDVDAEMNSSGTFSFCLENDFDCEHCAMAAPDGLGCIVDRTTNTSLAYVMKFYAKYYYREIPRLWRKKNENY